jgi:hypothetical protein
LIAARDNGFRAKDQDRIVLDTVGRYRTAMAEFAGMNNLEVWYAHLDVESVIAEYGAQFKPKLVKRAEKQVAKARSLGCARRPAGRLKPPAPMEARVGRVRRRTDSPM